MTKLSALIPIIAAREVGVEEINGTNCGPRVDEYKSATNLPPHEPWKWCAAFVDWVVKQAMEEWLRLNRPLRLTFKRPTTAGAWDLQNWSLRQDNSTNTKRNPGDDILPGDIVIYTFSHVGFAVSRAVAGSFVAIEGNTDDAGSREGGCVARQKRKTSKVKARIRFTV